MRRLFSTFLLLFSALLNAQAQPPAGRGDAPGRGPGGPVVVSPEVLKSYDGLGFLKAIVDGTLPHPPISEVLGFNLIDVAHGRAVFEGLPEYRHYNLIGTVHGGLAATLLDSALGCAVFSTLV